MSLAAAHKPAPAYVPFRLAGRPALVRGAAVIGATALLTLCSWITVPMVPVPVTMQTLAVTVVGALFGWRLGAIAVLAWLAEAAVGLPVLAGGTGGVVAFMGPTAGYLAAFVIVAALVGWCAERGWTSRNVLLCGAIMLAANALILAIGAAWLSHFVGLDHAIALGIAPFILGGVLKAALAAASIEAARRHLP